jgi:predicted nucleic acid-binding protein
MHILIDTNLILDVLTSRIPHYQNAALIWAAVETGKAKGSLAAHTINILHYLYARNTSKQTTRTQIARLLQVFTAAPIDGRVIQRALALGWDDFEDAVQMAAAENVRADGLVTRNPKDFRGGNVAIWQPGDFLALLEMPE